MPSVLSENQRRFALEAVRKLCDAGFTAYWAGGCVRDQLLDREPKDYDVATSAHPDEVRRLFGLRRTIPVGAAFGVINVVGPPGSGHLEVATFRRDTGYSDGRHPDEVAFSSAQEDASRRDFTINGLFYDPLAEKVIDFVGGQDDLHHGIVRAIGKPSERFAEDKLRLMRAVRFAAAFDFVLEHATFEAICRMAGSVTVVSPERISGEMRRMLTGPHRGRAVRMLLETGLAQAVLPEIVPETQHDDEMLERNLRVLEQLHEPAFPAALAALLYDRVAPDRAEEVCRRWRLANKETERTCWLVENYKAIDHATAMRWSEIQPFLIDDAIGELMGLVGARAEIGLVERNVVQWCRDQLARGHAALDPPPLLTGDDLLEADVPRGPRYRVLLQMVRAAQLNGEIATRGDALALVRRFLQH